MPIQRKPTHPGGVLWEDVIKPLGLTLAEGARRLGVSQEALSGVVHCKTPLTPEMAIRIGKATRTTPESWLYMQAKLDLWLADQNPTQVEVFEEAETV